MCKYWAYSIKSCSADCLNPHDDNDLPGLLDGKFGNVKYFNRKEILALQLSQLDAQREKLLAEEKYELLIELEEIYDKIKKEHDNL